MRENSTKTNWKLGQVKFFDDSKGYGFVNCWDDGEDYFVHISKIITEPIEEHDYVVFKLCTSRKKPETYEAHNLSLVSKFSQDIDYIIEQYLKYPNEHFRKNVIQSLTENDILELLEKEITKFKSIDSDDKYIDVNKIIKFYSSLNTNEWLQKAISSIISVLVDYMASPECKINFWLDGVIEKQPDEEIIKSYFKASDSRKRLIIFSHLDNSIQTILIRQYLLEGNPQEVLDFVLEHLKQINELNYNVDLKSKLYDLEYWSDKKGYDIFKTLEKYLLSTLDGKEKLSLFLSGYFNSLPSDFIVETCLKISKEEIEKLLEMDVLSKTEAFKLIDLLLSKEIEYFWSNENIPGQDFLYSAAEQDWMKYYQNLTESFKWILKICNHITESELAKIESKIIKKMPVWVQVELWESDFIKQIPSSSLARYLQTTDEPQMKVNLWLRCNKIKKDEISSILISNIQSQKVIKNRKEYYVLSNHLQALVDLKIDVTTLEDIILQSNLSFYKLALWIKGIGYEFSFNVFKKILVFLSPNDQIRFLKKVFWLAHTNKFDLTVEKLDQLIRIDLDIYKLNQEYNPDVHLDISVDIVIEAIKYFSENQKFLIESDLLKIVFKNITLNKKRKFKIQGLFEKCAGRCEAEFNWDTNGDITKVPFGNNQFYFAIQIKPKRKKNVRKGQIDYTEFVQEENFELLKEAVKHLPGSKWNQNEQHWGVPSKYESQVIQFARENRFFIGLEGSNYGNNTHLVEMKRKKVPNGITFCEGRLAKRKDRLLNQEFWWCTNQICFSNCESIHKAESWNEYTLLDFLIILGINIDDANRVGDYIERGKYYQFISTINRFNRLLERMYCEGCSNILFPVEDSHFAHYRVVRFQCKNTDCHNLHKEIYLHHCLNGKCNCIIDSRKSKKCPNGLYICSNNNCGCCCSHDMLSRRLSNLQTTGGFISKKLRNAVENKLGHLERAEHFCFKCGELMVELGDDIFECQSCSIQYDFSNNKFKRPHKPERHSEQSQAKNRPPDSFEQDNYPF